VSDEVIAFGDWKTNGEMFVDVARMGYCIGPVLDLTYGEGGFWTHYQPAELVTNDINPEKGDHHQDFRHTTWPARSFNTVVFDPPYKLSGTPASGAMDLRFGTDVVRTRNELLALIVGGIAEAARLADVFVLVKLMDQVNSQEVRWLTDVATLTGLALELRKFDSFILAPGGRKQPAGTTQQHARREHSTLLVFGRGKRRTPSG
jgi:hypothetical protein